MEGKYFMNKPSGLNVGVDNDLIEKMRSFLESIKDVGTHVDSGGGGGQYDFWVKHNGKQHFLTIHELKPY